MQVEAARVTSVGDSRADVELHTCLLLVPVQGHSAPDCWALWSALASSTPEDVCSQNKSYHCHWTVLIPQISKSGLRYSAPWEMLHSYSTSQGCAGDYRFLGLQGSCPDAFIPACTVHWRSVSRKPETKLSFQKTVFFPFPSRLESCQWVVHSNKGWTVIFVAYWFLFWAMLWRLHHHITGLILECKKDVSLTVKTTEGEEGSQVQDLIFPLPTSVFFFPVGECEFECGIRNIFSKGFRAESCCVVFGKGSLPATCFYWSHVGLGFLRGKKQTWWDLEQKIGIPLI